MIRFLKASVLLLVVLCHIPLASSYEYNDSPMLFSTKRRHDNGQGGNEASKRRLFLNTDFLDFLKFSICKDNETKRVFLHQWIVYFIVTWGKIQLGSCPVTPSPTAAPTPEPTTKTCTPLSSFAPGVRICGECVKSVYKTYVSTPNYILEYCSCGRKISDAASATGVYEGCSDATDECFETYTDTVYLQSGGACSPDRRRLRVMDLTGIPAHEPMQVFAFVRIPKTGSTSKWHAGQLPFGEPPKSFFFVLFQPFPSFCRKPEMFTTGRKFIILLNRSQPTMDTMHHTRNTKAINCVVCTGMWLLSRKTDICCPKTGRLPLMRTRRVRSTSTMVVSMFLTRLL